MDRVCRYVRPFPSGEGEWQVSANGGIEPKWRGDGKEIFYLAADRSLMAVTVKAGNALELSPASRLFATRMSVLTNTAFTSTQYAVTADGEHFFINQPRDGCSVANHGRGQLDGYVEELCYCDFSSTFSLARQEDEGALRKGRHR